MSGHPLGAVSTGCARPQGIPRISPQIGWPRPILDLFYPTPGICPFWDALVAERRGDGAGVWGASGGRTQPVQTQPSQSQEGWKSPLRSPSPTVPPAPPRLLNRVPKCHIYVFFEPLQGWGPHHCPGQPGPRLHNSFSEEIFPDIQSEPPLTQPEAVASRPVAGYLGEVAQSQLRAASTRSPRSREPQACRRASSRRGRRSSRDPRGVFLLLTAPLWLPFPAATSILKRQKQLRRKNVRFNQVTVYYFARCQGFTSVPSQGGSSLGMAQRHNSVRRYTLCEFAQEQEVNHREILREHLKEEKLHAKKMKVWPGRRGVAGGIRGKHLPELRGSVSPVGGGRPRLPFRTGWGWVYRRSNLPFSSFYLFFVSMLCPRAQPAGQHRPVPGLEPSAKPQRVRAGGNPSLGGGSVGSGGELGWLCRFPKPYPVCGCRGRARGPCPEPAVGPRQPALGEGTLIPPAASCFSAFFNGFFKTKGFSTRSSGGHGALRLLPLRLPAFGGLGTPIYPRGRDLGGFWRVGRAGGSLQDTARAPPLLLNLIFPGDNGRSRCFEQRQISVHLAVCRVP